MREKFFVIQVILFLIQPITFPLQTLACFQYPQEIPLVSISGDSIFAYSLEEALAQPDPNKVIGLALTGYDRFPSEALRFINIKALYFNECGLKEIPAEVNQLHRLTFIQVSRMMDIPKGISHVKHLQGLILSEMHIAQIPEEMRSLQQLYFFGCKFSNPTDLANLPFIQDAYFHAIDSSRIEDCFKGICSWKDLERLTLSEMNISRVPDCVSRLPDLTYLMIGYAKLDSFSENWSKNQSLSAIEILETTLTFLPDHLINMEKLQRLKLVGNQLPTNNLDRILEISPIDTIECRQGEFSWEKPQ